MAATVSPKSTGRLDRLSRRTRRALAVGTLLGLPAMFAWSAYWMSTTVATILWGPVSFVLIGLTLLGSVILYRFARDRASMPASNLDERQRQLRDRAWIMSYQVLSVVVIGFVAVVAIYAFVLERPIALDAGLVNALVLCVAVLLPILPTATLAWIEPDFPADE